MKNMKLLYHPTELTLVQVIINNLSCPTGKVLYIHVEMSIYIAKDKVLNHSWKILNFARHFDF